MILTAFVLLLRPGILPVTRAKCPVGRLSAKEAAAVAQAFARLARMDQRRSRCPTPRRRMPARARWARLLGREGPKAHSASGPCDGNAGRGGLPHQGDLGWGQGPGLVHEVADGVAVGLV